MAEAVFQNTAITPPEDLTQLFKTARSGLSRLTSIAVAAAGVGFAGCSARAQPEVSSPDESSAIVSLLDQRVNERGPTLEPEEYREIATLVRAWAAETQNLGDARLIAASYAGRFPEARQAEWVSELIDSRAAGIDFVSVSPAARQVKIVTRILAREARAAGLLEHIEDPEPGRPEVEYGFAEATIHIDLLNDRGRTPLADLEIGINIFGEDAFVTPQPTVVNFKDTVWQELPAGQDGPRTAVPVEVFAPGNALEITRTYTFYLPSYDTTGSIKRTSLYRIGATPEGELTARRERTGLSPETAAELDRLLEQHTQRERAARAREDSETTVRDAVESLDHPLVGRRAPSLDIVEWNAPAGVTRPIRTAADLSLEGKVTLVDFWAMWCGPCLSAMPHLGDLQQKYDEAGLQVVSLCGTARPGDTEGLDAYAPENLRHFVGKTTEETFRAYGVRGIPHLALIKDGVVVWVQTGSNADPEPAIRRALGLPPDGP